jgi:hypothetical protein
MALQSGGPTVDAPGMDDLFEPFEAVYAIVDGNAFVGLVGLPKQAGATDIRINTKLLEMAAIGGKGGTAIKGLADDLAQQLAEGGILWRRERGSDDTFFDVRIAVGRDSPHRQRDIALDPFAQTSNQSLCIIARSDTKADGETAGFGNHIGGQPSMNDAEVEGGNGIFREEIAVDRGDV